MNKGSKAKQELTPILTKAVQNLSTSYKGSSLTDVFILVDEDSGEVSVFDDEENCIVKETVEAWKDAYSSSDNFSESIYAKDLRATVSEMNDKEAFSSLNVFTPFSINLADENFIVLEELLLIEDDSVVRIESEFMERLDKEFDEFLERLLKD